MIATIVVWSLKNGGIKNLEETLSTEALQKWQEDIHRSSWGVSLPKFDVRADYDLVPHLNDLGIKSAFTGGGLAGIAEDVSVDTAIQSTRMTVDESGTHYLSDLCLGNNEYSEIIVDSPFLFFIMDDESGAILFMGRVMDPTV